MPSVSYKPCARTNCPNLTKYPEKFCGIHQIDEKQDNAYRNKHYDNLRKDDFVYQFYKSKEWKKIRECRLSLDHHLCQPCLRNKLITKATIVHHIEAIRNNWDQRLVIKNLESSCQACHNRSHRNW